MGYDISDSLGFADANISDQCLCLEYPLTAVLNRWTGLCSLIAGPLLSVVLFCISVLTDTASVHFRLQAVGISGYLSDHVRYCIFDRNAGTEVKKSGKTVRNGGFPHKDFV